MNRLFTHFLRLAAVGFLFVFLTGNVKAEIDTVTQLDVHGSAAYAKFGTHIVNLPNGNIVVSDPYYDPPETEDNQNLGALFLYDGRTLDLISMMTGEKRDAFSAYYNFAITVLTNGNYVVSAAVPSSSPSLLMNAVRFCSAVTGCSGTMTAANSLVGNKLEDYIASRIVPLKNGNYLVLSWNWNNGQTVSAGAVTWCDGTTGCTGAISPANSLVGDNAFDEVGGITNPLARGIVELANGDYIVSNPRWNNFRGAVTLCPRLGGCTGVVSPENSLVGSIGQAGDEIGDRVGGVDSSRIGVTELANGNYVVSSVLWGVNDIGASTWCSVAVGCRGPVTAENSLTGVQGADQAGVVYPLSNGNYVALTPLFDANELDVGAVTLCSEPTGCKGTISASNSLVGDGFGDMVGYPRITPLSNGNYLALSLKWHAGRGAVTFLRGDLPATGVVSSQNSLVGTARGISDGQDRVGTGQILELSNGNYVVSTPNWWAARGASTFGSGMTGVSGEISNQNSLVGIDRADLYGTYGIALPNGNYVVASQGWNGKRGAATLCSGLTGCPLVLTPQNSLVGESPGDIVGSSKQQLVALASGNYLVISDHWGGGRGAVTWANGQTGITGLVSTQNSLTGDMTNDYVGKGGVTKLADGNYVVVSSDWHGSGAVTFRRDANLAGEIVSSSNSLVSTDGGRVGHDDEQQGVGGGVYPGADGSYVVRSKYWQNGNISQAGAVTLAAPGGTTTGPITQANSICGTSTYYQVVFGYNNANHELVVGRPDSNMFSVLRIAVTIGGRVLASDGRGLRNARVSLTDSHGAVRIATTSSFGIFSFAEVLSGETYSLNVASKRYRFTPQTVTVNGDLTLPDLIGLE